MTAILASRRMLRRIGLALLMALSVALVVGVTTAGAQDEEPSCGQGYTYDPGSGECVNVALVDCGPSPYNYNAVGGFWEREFNKWCFEPRDDAFESFFHGLTWPEAQAQLRALGLEGLTHEQQVTALFAFGLWNPVDALDSTDVECPDGTDWNILAQRCETIEPPDCGPNPYTFNTVGNHWERRFHNLCFESRDDPFEILFHGMTFAEAQTFLASKGLSGLSHDAQVNALSSLGYRDAFGAFIPVSLPPTSSTTTTTTTTTAGSTYVVQRGDWLAKIARSLGVSVADLIRLNSGTYPTLLTNPDVLYVGWVLRVP